MMDSIRSALKNNLTLSCFFVIGFPGETAATLRETRRLIHKLAWMGVQDVGVAKFVPYAGSRLFQQFLTQNRIRLDDVFFLSPSIFMAGPSSRSATPGLSRPSKSTAG